MVIGLLLTQNLFRKPADKCMMPDGKRDFGPQQEDALTNRTITLNDNEYGDVTAALELMINHCDAFDGPTNPFLARRKNCEALLQKLRSASLSPRVR